MATITVKPIPSQYQEVIDKCDEMDWDVEKSPTSVKVIPPKGSKVKPFNMPRSTPWAPPQLAKNLQENGFLAAYKEFKDARDGVKKPDAVATAAAKLGKKVRVCEYCEKDPEIKEPFTTTHPPALGVHQRHKHGILGKSAEAARKRDVTAAKKAAGKKVLAKTAAPAKTAAVPSKSVVPAPRAAATVKQEPLINLSGLPVSVAAPLGELIAAVGATSGDAVDLQKEVEKLRDFRDQVEAEVNDGNKAPIKILAAIQDLVQETKQK